MKVLGLFLRTLATGRNQGAEPEAVRGWSHCTQHCSWGIICGADSYLEATALGAVLTCLLGSGPYKHFSTCPILWRRARKKTCLLYSQPRYLAEIPHTYPSSRPCRHSLNMTSFVPTGTSQTQRSCSNS